jgi:hypothetical protein
MPSPGVIDLEEPLKECAKSKDVRLSRCNEMENIAEQSLGRLLIIDIQGAACCVIYSETEHGVHFVSEIHADCCSVVEEE